MNADDDSDDRIDDAISPSVERSRALDARSEALDQFARTAAHDLRAPLRSIEAFTRLAIESEDATEIDDFLGRALNATIRMRTLLDALLEFADSGQPKGELSLAPLTDVVQAAMADMANDWDEAGAAIDLGPLPHVLCDPTQLRRVFVNLFANSIRYCTERSPEIVVRATELETELIVTVTDNGDGFPPEFADVVFLPFRRISTSGDGQGLGLAICRRIIESHGGTIEARTEPARGTTVTIRLKRPDDATREEGARLRR